METEVFEYFIDANDVITQVNDAWRDFAERNAGEGLGDRVVGTWLWQHLSGIEVKHLFRVLLEKVREDQRSIRIPFRCDGPEIRRYMLLELNPLADGAVRFSSWVEVEEARGKMHLLVADRPEDPHRFLRMCAWCKRIGSDGDEEVWRELEEALTEMELFNMEPLPRITHGVCPDCQSRILRELEGAEGAGKGWLS